MKDRFDCDVHDPEALAEIGLATDLMIAASESRERLSEAMIDAILGLTVYPAQ